MNLMQLTYFKSVVDRMSFTKAARELYVSQSAVSQQIHLLENELECQLLHRRGRNFRLTPDGEFIYQKAKRILSEFEGLRDELKSRGEKVFGKLKIGSGPVATRIVLTNVVSEMLRRFPDISFSLFEINSDNLTRAIVESRIDLGIGIIDYENKQIRSEKLLTGRLILICSTKSDWSSRQSVSSRELSKINLIRHAKETPKSSNFAKRFNENKTGANFQLEAMYTETIVSFVQRNMGMALTPDYIIRLLSPKGIATIELEENIELDWGIMSDKFCPVSKASQVFIDHLKQQVPQMHEITNNLPKS